MAGGWLLPWCVAALALQGCGAKGPSAEEQPPVVAQQDPSILVAGRWGMFHFEDPVAVALTQTAPQLTGLGCDGGLTSDDPDHPNVEPYCGRLSGEIVANKAWFEFKSASVTWRADVSVSNDSSRMSGVFTDAAGRPFKSSWLRLRDDQPSLARLEGLPPDRIAGGYALSLIASESPGSSYQPDHTYQLAYSPGMGLYGDLGAFYYTELSQSVADAPIHVGPVPSTDPALPVSIQLDHDATSLTRVTAVDAAGVVAVFAATRVSK